MIHKETRFIALLCYIAVLSSCVDTQIQTTRDSTTSRIDAVLEPSDWDITTFDNEHSSRNLRSFLNPDDTITVVYLGSSALSPLVFKSAQRSGTPSSWRLESIGNPHELKIDRVDAAADVDGKLHIAGKDLPFSGEIMRPREVRYMTNVNGSWSSEVIDRHASDSGVSIKIGVHPDSGVHVAFGGYNGGLAYMNRMNGVWSREILELPTAANKPEAHNIAMAVDRRGCVHLVFSFSYYSSESYSRESFYYKRCGALWERETLAFDVYEPHLVVDDHDVAHMSYRAFGPTADRYWGRAEFVYYANTSEGMWKSEIVDDFQQGECLSYRNKDISSIVNAIAISPEGTVHIAYNSNCPLDLRYARRLEGGSWRTISVGPFNRGADELDIAVDRNDSPILVYHQSYGNDFQIATPSLAVQGAMQR